MIERFRALRMFARRFFWLRIAGSMPAEAIIAEGVQRDGAPCAPSITHRFIDIRERHRNDEFGAGALDPC